MLEAGEPTANLASDAGAAIEETLFRLNKEKGITPVIAAHGEV